MSASSQHESAKHQPTESTPSGGAAGGVPWYRRIGPGLITACVVIGPGSILTSSTVGRDNGYGMLWIVVVSVVFMLVYMTMGARLGVIADKPPAELIRDRAGHWLAVLVGVSVFFISAAFQSGNNLGVGAAFEAYVDNKWAVAGMVLAFNAVAIAFLFAFSQRVQGDRKADDGVCRIDAVEFSL